ncbi:ABC-2 type transport system ATP-binding protein [Gracilibacillus ureilyticus]|uniref:ABC-2 type transport system ATP-binding protein n=1 Tax=Gracilibacillus ureilyticus TaxID=531814 RepID=A0A1H9PJP2_9BACI|nr:ABC transporter ATP-binding protein [Gracilibacillus ureilyticus]SER48432.1 ABC-2 type transport system ATP-binding protein [Gracilibacillus ureilyticus]
MMEIKAVNVRKQYQKEVALDDLTITLEGNKIIGLLGKNGAGKTTLMRLLAGHFSNSSGQLTIDNKSPFNNYPVLREVCLIMESNNFHEKFRVKDILNISANFYPNWDNEYANHLVNVFRLNINQKAKTLSKGMYSALGIIVGLASNASLTIFDEPYIGLDASFRSTFYDLLLETYQNNPRMIILSTHLIDEVSRLFEEVAILHEGKLMLHDTADNFERKHLILTGSKEEVDQLTSGRNIIHSSSIMGQKTVVLYNEDITDSGNLKVSKASLQELFVYLTKEEVNKNGTTNQI